MNPLRQFVAVVAVLGALAAPGAVAAADPPELGGTLAAPPYGVSLDPAHDANWVMIANLSTVPAGVTVTATEGWELGNAPGILDPGERATVTVTAIGSEPGIVTLTLDPSVTGMDISTLTLNAALNFYDPPDEGSVPWLLILPPLGLAIGVALGLYSRRRYPRGR